MAKTLEADEDKMTTPNRQLMTQKKAGPVWVMAEHEEGQVLPVSFQMIGKARELADRLNVPVEAILLGTNTKNMIPRLFSAGVDRVYAGDDAGFAQYQSDLFCHVIVALAKEHQPDIMLLGSTPAGRELAPLVAAGLETGLTAHCIDLVLNDNHILEQKIPAYGGLLTIVCEEKRPQMATVAKGVFPDPEMDEGREGDVVAVEIPKDMPSRVQTIEVVREDPKGVPLESASVVVAGGAGAGDLEGWRKVADLASALNAALGSTRPAVDEGWIELESMIGQSGKMVSPELYIGVGLSGELQHMVGIVDARVMVAINNDAKSPIFEQVDFGIVDDCREFLPILIEKLKGVK
jgi:electron transfer flavoprotein alpha subunit